MRILRTVCLGLSLLLVIPAAFADELTTLFASNNSFAGNTFDISVTTPVTITGFDVNLEDGADTTMTVYYKLGTAEGFESDAGAWTLLGSDVVTPQGTDVPTPINVGNLTLNAGQVYGFYVDVTSYPSSSLMYTNGGPTDFSNGTMTLHTLHGKGNPAFTGANFFPRQWNGTVYYNLAGPPQPIPSLSEWGMIILSVLMALGAILTLRRRMS